MTLLLYLEGLGFRSIGRLLGVSQVSAMNWIKHFGEKIEELKSDGKLEIDEMHTYHVFPSNSLLFMLLGQAFK